MIIRQEDRAMSNEPDQLADPGRPMDYRMRIAGELDSRWADWFEGMTITLDGGDTLITGPVVDQAALHGLLRKVRDLGLPLVSVSRVAPEPPGTRAAGQAGPSGVTSGSTHAACLSRRLPGEGGGG
jgi:hypothetical protein